MPNLNSQGSIISHRPIICSLSYSSLHLIVDPSCSISCFLSVHLLTDRFSSSTQSVSDLSSSLLRFWDACVSQSYWQLCLFGYEDNMRRGLAAQKMPLGWMFWTEEETGPLMHGVSLCGEKSFSMWVDRFVSNLDRSFMHKQGCVVCVHVRVSFFEGFSGV